MRSFNYTNWWVYRNLSRHATWHQRSYLIALKQGNQNPRNNMIASCSFASTADVAQCRSNYLTQRAEILTRRSSLTPQRAKNTVNDLSVVSVVPKSLSNQSKLTSQFPLFSSRDHQAADSSLLRIEVILANTWLLLNTLRKKNWSHEVGLDRYLGTFIREPVKLLT